MKKTSDDEVLARVAASSGRRFIGIGMMVLLAVLVIYVAVKSPPSLGWQLFLVAMGSIALMMANAMRKSTLRTLELTKHEIRDDAGNLVVALEDIASIDRGAFAFKPSNGFVLRLKKPYARDWKPGLWWRAARRIGVGGMTPMRETKYMAEIIAVMLEERKGQ